LNQQSDRYISFVKGKSPQKISDYFRNFIGIEENDYNPKADNDNLVDALDNYSSQSELSIEEMQENKKKAYQYCQQQAKDGNLIELNELSSAINEASPKDFSDYIKAEPYSIEQQLLPDRKSLRQILRYNGFSPGMRISFDKALLGYSVFYDKNTDTLTIKGIPDNLRDQLT
jgi:nucleoid-associated protein